MPLRMIRVDRKSLGHGIQFRWSSIFSGAFVTLGFGLFFMLLGNAIGLSIVNTFNPAIGGALRFWSWIYVAGTSVLSYFLGSFFCTRSNEILSVAAGGLHGLIAWGLATIVGTALAEMASSTVLRVLQGGGPRSLNWLAACVVGLGLPSAVLGGLSGKEATRYSRVEGEGTAAEGERRIQRAG